MLLFLYILLLSNDKLVLKIICWQKWFYIKKYLLIFKLSLKIRKNFNKSTRIIEKNIKVSSIIWKIFFQSLKFNELIKLYRKAFSKWFQLQNYLRYEKNIIGSFFNYIKFLNSKTKDFIRTFSNRYYNIKYQRWK